MRTVEVCAAAASSVPHEAAASALCCGSVMAIVLPLLRLR